MQYDVTSVVYQTSSQKLVATWRDVTNSDEGAHAITVAGKSPDLQSEGCPPRRGLKLPSEAWPTLHPRRAEVPLEDWVGAGVGISARAGSEDGLGPLFQALRKEASLPLWKLSLFGPVGPSKDEVSPLHTGEHPLLYLIHWPRNIQNNVSTNTWAPCSQVRWP